MKKLNRFMAAFLAVATLLSVSSCKDEDPQTASFDIGDNFSNGYTAKVTFTEVEDEDKTIVAMTLYGTVSGMTYAMHIHNGSLTNYGGIVHDLGTVAATGTSASSSTTLDIAFNTLNAYDGLFAAHDAANLANIVVAGEVGAP